MTQDTTGRPAGYVPEGIDDALVGDGAPPQLPALGVVGWLRWTWRQLTSMRVALLLLMLLAVAAVPGTIFPQRPQDPARVATYLTDHPDLGPLLDRLGMFDVYASVWFSAIYLLLFVSLVGCILPRSRTHLRALRNRPPRTPRRFDRFPARAETVLDGSPAEVARQATAALRPRFRVDVQEERAGTWTVAAERGYLRETGNLVFHLALVGLLVSIATGQLLHYRGQAIAPSPTRRATTTPSRADPASGPPTSTRSRCGWTASPRASTRRRCSPATSWPRSPSPSPARWPTPTRSR
jgi:cytochrome c biogenesis protein